MLKHALAEVQGVVERDMPQHQACRRVAILKNKIQDL